MSQLLRVIEKEELWERGVTSIVEIYDIDLLPREIGERFLAPSSV